VANKNPYIIKNAPNNKRRNLACDCLGNQLCAHSVYPKHSKAKPVNLSSFVGFRISLSAYGAILSVTTKPAVAQKAAWSSVLTVMLGQHISDICLGLHSYIFVNIFVENKYPVC